MIHCIANRVTVNFVANTLLALGALPAMAHAVEEVEDMVDAATGLSINMGTPCPEMIAAMVQAAKRAAFREIPVAFDPVGVGATGFRTASAQSIMATGAVTAVRGNASEIRNLYGEAGLIKGVDTVHSVDEVAPGLDAAARHKGAVLCVTGAQDLISNGNQRFWVKNGHPLMSRVTGMGCAATAVIAAFLAVDDDPAEAAAAALAVFGLAGEMAGKTAKGPGSFSVAFIDALYTMKTSDILVRCSIHQGIELTNP